MTNIENLERRIFNLEKRVDVLEGSPHPRSPRKAVSPKEFLLSHKSASEVHTAFLLCCYAERNLGMEFFNTADIEKLFRSAHVPVPANLNAVMDKNASKGLLTSAKEKKSGRKSWVVTLMGEQELEKEERKS